MGTAIGPEGWRTGPTDLLAELYTRAQLANRELPSLVDGQKKYFYVSTEAIIDVFDLPADKADMLRDFAEKAVNLLDKAYPQAEAKLQKLLKALENSNVKVELSPRGKKTLHIVPTGEKFYVSARMRSETWLFRLPIHKISQNTEFPDILKMPSNELYYLQAGWRASDEGVHKGKPRMETTKPWQIYSWATVRFGAIWIYLGGLNLNTDSITIEWQLIAKSWQQQWPTREGKKTAQEIAKGHLLGLVAWYLGDGEKHEYDLIYSIGDDEIYLPKELTEQMIQITYKTRYGILLDLLESDKWIALKNLKPKRKPIRATFQDHVFWLDYYNKKRMLQACTLLKDLGEALKLEESLENMGLHARIYTRRTGLHMIKLSGNSVLKLAENSPEWRMALKQLAEKHNLQPKTPMLRRLLELAENPPPAKKPRKKASPC